MYDLGPAPGVKQGDGDIVVDIWEKNLNFLQRTWLLFRLDLLEAIYLRYYQRVKIDTPKGVAWTYLWRRSVKDKTKITDWIIHRHS
jgi:gamma-glutamylcyclotransferase (GGCT)/AIG2-like uncharacterized protein YtfP